MAFPIKGPQPGGSDVSALRRSDVYAYFNNDWGGYAPRNALRLLKLQRALPSPRPAGTTARR